MFFEQKFKIFHDNGNIEFVDNLFEYLQNYDITTFYYKMKFSLKSENKPFVNHRGYKDYWYNQNKFEIRSFYLYTENNIMISPDLLMNEYNSLYKELFEYRNDLRNKVLTHKYSKRRHTSRQLKQVTTLHNLRNISSVLKDEGEPEFRSKHKVYMPYWFDDLPPSRRSTSWKVSTKRKRQYKGS